MSELPARRQNVQWHQLLRRAAVLGGISVLGVYAAIAAAAVITNWYFNDAQGYWEAGERLRNGEALYPSFASQDAPEVYRYAPWFAWIWFVLTFLPRDLVMLGWAALLVGACAYLLYLLPRNATGVMLALLFAPMLFRVVSQGNAHPLMVAGLAFGMARSSGPIWIGLAASLKLVPLLFAAVYVANREYRRALLAAAVTVILWLPAVGYSLASYPTAVGGESFPIEWFTFVIAAGALAAVFLVPARFRALAASVAVTFASPRWIPYNATYVMAAQGRTPEPSSKTWLSG